MARTTASWLKAISSSKLPPPRATMTTSASWSSLHCRSAATRLRCDAVPCTRAEYRISRVLGNRSQIPCCRSWITAPLGEVIRAMQRGKNGRARLRSGREGHSPSQAAFERLDRRSQFARPVVIEFAHHEVDPPVLGVIVDLAGEHQLLPV